MKKERKETKEKNTFRTLFMQIQIQDNPPTFARLGIAFSTFTKANIKSLIITNATNIACRNYKEQSTRNITSQVLEITRVLG